MKIIKWTAAVLGGLFFVLLLIGTLAGTPDDDAGAAVPGGTPDDDAGAAGGTPETQWRNTVFTDAFGEDTGDVGAYSPRVYPVPRLAWPYADRQASLFVNCDRAWVRFTDTMNLVGTDFTATGDPSYRIRVRVDSTDYDVIGVNRLTSPRDLNLLSPDAVIAALADGESVSVLVPQHEDGLVRFTWDLRGSAAVIADSCD